MTKEMKINKTDLVLIAAGVLFLLIVGESIYYLHFASAGWKDAYDEAVKGTLVPLFATVAGLKVAYTTAVHILNKFADK
jgi:hypothetical protein